ncbi:MAG TPA: hypothetical protein VHA11_01355 [Bryobacteraceae bacterium]|nr:hypothetical protein [Bryobacteraceae bacterium]
MRCPLLLLGSVAFCVFVPACARRTSQLPVPPTLAPGAADLSRDLTASPAVRDDVSGSIDLRPGWRLRVVTPLLKSGGYALRSLPAAASGNTVTLAAGGEFQGYETAYYAIAPHPKGGVRIALASVEVTRDGASAPQGAPALPLFQLPQGARFVRLVFLTRVSPADHDMAVVGAASTAELDRFAAEVQANPRACGAAGRHYCAWIPSGIAVRAEALGAGTWEPVR